MSTAFGILGTILMEVFGMAFLIPGIIGTAVTGKVKHGTKVARVFSVIALVIGIILCATPIVVAILSSIA